MIDRVCPDADARDDPEGWVRAQGLGGERIRRDDSPAGVLHQINQFALAPSSELWGQNETAAGGGKTPTRLRVIAGIARPTHKNPAISHLTPLQ